MIYKLIYKDVIYQQNLNILCEQINQMFSTITEEFDNDEKEIQN